MHWPSSKYLWKESKKGILEISKYDSDLFLRYLDDMEMGLNVAVCTKKGSRSYANVDVFI